MAEIGRRAVVGGRVQGVGFRYSCASQARALGVRGWVRNLVDGRVEVQAEGPEEKVETLLRWLRKGPPFARVTDVTVSEADPTGAPTFDIF